MSDQFATSMGRLLFDPEVHAQLIARIEIGDIKYGDDARAVLGDVIPDLGDTPFGEPAVVAEIGRPTSLPGEIGAHLEASALAAGCYLCVCIPGWGCHYYRIC